MIAWFRRLTQVTRRRDLEEGMRTEMEFHIECRAADLRVQRGVSQAIGNRENVVSTRMRLTAVSSCCPTASAPFIDVGGSLLIATIQQYVLLLFLSRTNVDFVYGK